MNNVANSRRDCDLVCLPVIFSNLVDQFYVLKFVWRDTSELLWAGLLSGNLTGWMGLPALVEGDRSSRPVLALPFVKIALQKMRSDFVETYV